MFGMATALVRDILDGGRMVLRRVQGALNFPTRSPWLSMPAVYASNSENRLT